MADAPLILFGAFDRHNLGDLLLAHVAAAEAAPRPLVFAGLADRDLTGRGGHKVRAIARLAREWGDRRADLVHVGGELLTCERYEAAVMLQTREDAEAVVADLDADPPGRERWAQANLGLTANLPYLAAKALFRRPGRFEFRAVGGVEFDRLAPASRDEALARLREADGISVRDRTTQAHLAAAGIPAALRPDPVSRIATLFGKHIRRHADQGEPAAARMACPSGYLALQFAAEYGDDPGLDRLAAHLETGLGERGLVLFRAGAAPWHDDLAVYRRLAERLPGRRVHLFRSLDVWDICALIAGASGYCGSSLHGWVVAQAFGVATLPFPLPLHTKKLAAYVSAWDTAVPAGETASEHQGEPSRISNMRSRSASDRARRMRMASRATRGSRVIE